MVFILLTNYIGIRGDIIYFCFGSLIPLINVFILENEIYSDFPWEIYIYFVYLAMGIFMTLNTVIVYLGLGYILPRLYFYFKAKDE